MDEQQDTSPRRRPRDVVSLVLREKWNVERLKFFVSSPAELTPFQRKMLLKTYTLLRYKNTNELTVDYYPSKLGAQFTLNGRIHTRDVGVQNMPGWVRRLAMEEYYIDVDIQNCYPTLLYQIAKKVNYTGSITTLGDIVENRDEVIRKEQQNFPGLSYSQVKSVILKITFGCKSLESNESNYEERRFFQSSEMIRHYKSEISNLADFLYNLPIYRHFKFAAETRDNSKYSCLSLIINDEERKIIDCAMRYTKEIKKLAIGVYMYDGFMIEKNSIVDDGFLAELDTYVLLKTGFNVKFIIKSLKPTHEDFEKITPFNKLYDFSFVMFQCITKYELSTNDKYSENKGEALNDLAYTCVPLMNQCMAFIECNSQIFLKAKEYGGFFDVRRMKDTKSVHQVTIKYKDQKEREREEKVALFNVWLDSKLKLSFEDCQFNPGLALTNSRILNTFTGIRYPPNISERYTPEEMADLVKQDGGPLYRFVNHIFEVWCQREQHVFDFVMKWLAATIVKPHVKLQSAIVLKSEQGAGKGIVVSIINDILGEEYKSQPNSLEALTSGFNAPYWERALLIFLDECFFSGNKSTKNLLKTKITDRQTSISKKYCDDKIIDVFANIIIASNEAHVINIDHDTRRFLVLELDNKYTPLNKNQTDSRNYFTELANTDKQLLSNYFHSMDLENYDGSGVPRSRFRSEQIVLSFASDKRFLHDVLFTPGIIAQYKLHNPNNEYDDEDELEGEYLRSPVYDEYLKRNPGRYHIIEKNLWHVFKEVIDGFKVMEGRVRHDGKVFRKIYFPKKEEARASFIKNLKLDGYSFE